MYRDSLQEYFTSYSTFTVFSLQPIFINWKSYFGGIRKALENDHKLGSMLTVWVTVHFYDGKVVFADQLITHCHHIKRKSNLDIKRFIFLMVSNAFNSLINRKMPNGWIPTRFIWIGFGQHSIGSSWNLSFGESFKIVPTRFCERKFRQKFLKQTYIQF